MEVQIHPKTNLNKNKFEGVTLPTIKTVLNFLSFTPNSSIFFLIDDTELKPLNVSLLPVGAVLDFDDTWCWRILQGQEEALPCLVVVFNFLFLYMTAKEQECRSPGSTHSSSQGQQWSVCTLPFFPTAFYFHTPLAYNFLHLSLLDSLESCPSLLVFVNNSS